RFLHAETPFRGILYSRLDQVFEEASEFLNPILKSALLEPLITVTKRMGSNRPSKTAQHCSSNSLAHDVNTRVSLLAGAFQ
ncbi:MAG: hypothetical protein K2Y15_07025, partial [Burkholderiaceae bacterium]|nr:hypothetical protein [Burkholderiaceae bacterium]